MAKRNEGINEWINYCWEMMRNNPYVLPEGEVSHDFDKDLERAVKHKIYHTALYEYKCKLDRIKSNAEINMGKNEYSIDAIGHIQMTIKADNEDEARDKLDDVLNNIYILPNSPVNYISEIGINSIDRVD